MKRKEMKSNTILLTFLAALAGLGASVVDMDAAWAEPQKNEYADYDDELMKDLERTIKYFEPDVTAENQSGVTDDLAVLRQGFVYTQQYFAKRGNAPDAVKISQDGLKALDAVQQNVAAQKTEEAAAKAREAADACKACHDIYKPKQARG